MSKEQEETALQRWNPAYMGPSKRRSLITATGITIAFVALVNLLFGSWVAGLGVIGVYVAIQVARVLLHPSKKDDA